MAWAKRARAHPRTEEEIRRSAEVVGILFASAGGVRRRRAECWRNLRKAVRHGRLARRLGHRRRLADLLNRMPGKKPTNSCAPPTRRDLPALGCARASGLRPCKRAWTSFAGFVCGRVPDELLQQHFHLAELELDLELEPDLGLIEIVREPEQRPQIRKKKSAQKGHNSAESRGGTSRQSSG